MRYLLVAILFSSNVFAIQTPATLEQVLGREKVESILKKVINRKIESYSKSYLVTEELLKEARSVGVPSDTLTKLENIKGQQFQGEGKFQDALNKTIGQQDADRFESVITSNARGYLIVTDDFISRVEKLVLRTEAPDTGDREKWLEDGFERFLSEYISFSVKEGKNRITLATNGPNARPPLDSFINTQRAKCGEIPCSVPPCCGKTCKACRN
jgi:hypothetical protein